uniref:Uncharacterized protein n=1 Tax=Vespula pensylvanica TaxID=30213 RepID=A0A834NBU7_VESPE|nr:hypothetical protein H0235_014959 [Vespula pensylvanica]
MPESTYLGSRGSPRVKGLQGKSENHGLRDVAIKVSGSSSSSRTPAVAFEDIFNPFEPSSSSNLNFRSA